MKKSDLIIEIRRLYPFLLTEQVKHVIDIIFKEITNALAQGRRVEIRGFGAISVKKRKIQLNFFDPSTKTISFGEKNVIYFRMGKEFFDRLNDSKTKAT